MAKISAAKKAQFADPELETFVVANTPEAFETLDPRVAEHPTCVVCGAPIKYVFLTNYGPMGGDCYATLSGSPETRSAYRKMFKLLDQVQRWGGAQWSLWGHQIMWMQIDVQKSFRQAQPLVWVRLHQYDPDSRREYDRNVGYIPEQPGVVEYFEGWAAEHGIQVVPKGYRENPTLTEKDKKVIEAFLEGRDADGKMLESLDGELRRVGVGAEVVAKWIDGNMVETSTESTKFDESILRFLRKRYRKHALRSKLDIEFVERPLRAGGAGRSGVVTATLQDQRVGRLEWGDSEADPGKYTIVMIKVEPAYQRRGVATAIYKAWMDHYGIRRSDLAPTNKTAAGAAFRKRADRFLPNPAPVKIDHDGIARLADRLTRAVLRFSDYDGVVNERDMSYIGTSGMGMIEVRKQRFAAIGGDVRIDVYVNMNSQRRNGVGGELQSVTQPGQAWSPDATSLVVEVGGDWSAAGVADAAWLRREIERVLVHEATHVARMRHLKSYVFETLDKTQYANEPEEVEARAQEIADDVVRSARGIEKAARKVRGRQGFVPPFGELLALSDTWRRYGNLLTPKNERIVRQKAARAYTDAVELLEWDAALSEQGQPATAEHGISVRQRGYEDNPTQAVTDDKLATLTKLEQDDPDSFATWVKEEAQADDWLLQDRDGRADLIADWIQETCNLSVRDDGLIEFYQLTDDDDCDVAYTIGDLPVVVYHHTATGALPGIIERGGLAPAVNLGYKATKHDSGAYVFVTTEFNGPAVDGYVRRAMRRFGGDPVTLEIRSYLHRLEPDPDDADISSGRTQFVLPYVDLKDIVSGLERSPCAPLVDRFLPNG
jgi:GNAT superfamily N-acetyltransferase